jgi:hypothetical protein
MVRVQVTSDSDSSKTDGSESSQWESYSTRISKKYASSASSGSEPNSGSESKSGSSSGGGEDRRRTSSVVFCCARKDTSNSNANASETNSSATESECGSDGNKQVIPYRSVSQSSSASFQHSASETDTCIRTDENGFRLNVLTSQVIAEVPTQMFPAGPPGCDCLASPCELPSYLRRPIFLPAFQGMTCQVSPSETYLLKSGSIDTEGRAEIFEIVTSMGYQSLFSAPQTSDTFLFVVAGGYTLQVSSQTLALTVGSFVYVRKGTPYGLTHAIPTAGRILSGYLPPGTFGYFAEVALCRKNAFAVRFNPRLAEKYGITLASRANYRNPLFCSSKKCLPDPFCGEKESEESEDCDSSFSSLTSDYDTAPETRDKKERTPPMFYLPNAIPIQNISGYNVGTIKQPTPVLPHVDYATKKIVPFRNFVSTSITTAPLYVRTNTAVDPTAWRLLASQIDTNYQAEIVYVTLTNVAPLQGQYSNDYVFLYFLAPTSNTTVSIGIQTFPATPFSYFLIPKGAYFAVQVAPVPVGSLDAPYSAAAVMGFLGRGAFGYIKGTIDVRNVADAGSIAPSIAEQEILSLAARYCFVTPVPFPTTTFTPLVSPFTLGTPL